MAGFAIYPSLKDAVLLVSGGASGIGADIVRAAHGQGAKVAFLDIQDVQGKTLADSLPGSQYLHCDLTRIADLESAVNAVRKKLGPIRVLVNNAANDDRRGPMEIDEAYWDWSMDVNLKHQFFLAQKIMPHMRELGGGSIINFSSISWRYGSDAIMAYQTAKSAITGLTRALSRNFGPYNIRVNTVEPGAVMTEKQKCLWYPTPEAVKAMIDRQRLKRELTGGEIARTVMFLASEDSRMITGQSIIIDAGMS